MRKSFILAVTIILSISFSYDHGYAQQAGNQVPVKIPITASTPNALLYLPLDYNNTTHNYPLICFFHGLGEDGTNLDVLVRQGLPYVIKEGHPPYSINKVTGDTTWFIVLSIQASWWSPSPEAMIEGISTLINDYAIRVDTNRIYPTGLSAGGKESLFAIMNYPSKFPAAVVMSPAAAIYTSKVDNFANDYVWFFQGTSDKVVSLSNAYNSNNWINDKYPGHSRLHKYDAGHCCWIQFYEPTWRDTDGLSIYDFMLQYERNTPNSQANQDPVAVSGSDINIVLPQNSVILDGSGSSDPDGKIVSYKWTKKSGPEAYQFDDSTLSKPTVSNLEAGTYIFTLTVTDDSAATASAEVTVTVNEAAASNQPPVANAGLKQTLTLPANAVTLDGSESSDPDGQIVSYKWTKKSGPEAYQFDDSTLSKPTVSNLEAGTYIFTLAVTDDSAATASAEVTVTVNEAAAPNQPPVANAGLKQTLTLPANAVTLDGSGSSDPDGKIVSYKWMKKSGPEAYQFDDSALSKPTVNNLEAGTYIFTLTVTDDSAATASAEVTVTVNEAAATNQFPVAEAGLEQTLTLPANSVTLDGSESSDPDGKIVSYKWMKKSGPEAYQFDDSTLSKPTVSNLEAGTYIFTLTVTDDSAATASAEVTVTVNEAAVLNQPPVANAGPEQTLTLPANSVTLNGSASSDPDGQIVSYKWMKKSGPEAYQFDDSTLSKPTVSNLEAGTYIFTLTVTDDSAATASAEVTVTVNEAAAPNQFPVAEAGLEQTLTLPPANAVTLDGSESSDPDGKIVSYKWMKKSGPEAYQFDDSTLSKPTVSNLEAGTYIFTLTVTDDSAATASNDVIIQVKSNNNGLPVADAGQDITIYYPIDNIYLDGSNSYTSGGILYHWEKISGPASFLIKNPTRAITQVRNLVPGKYLFELTVKDYGRNSTTDKVAVTVLPDPVQPGDVSFTANTKVLPYTAPFQYGTNPSSYGNGWGDTAIAGIANKAGVHSLRLPLPDFFVEHYGYDIRLNAFNYYTHQLGMQEITLFAGRPSPDHRDPNTYAPATTQSKVFDHLYEPIWDNGENGTPVNDNNYFAVYIYKLAKHYGKNIKFWEIVNEPDITGFWDNGRKDRPDSWWNVAPNPESLLNLKAPIYYYIRMLRIAYEVIKKIDPEDYITPGGLGYPAFLDALLRYTDNPDGGKITAKYPLTGGAYFDILSFHCYPAYNLRVWDNSIGGFRHYRHSDRAADAVIDLKNTFDSVLINHGYNGRTHPKKDFIITETNIPRKDFSNYWGGEEAQRNFIIKILIQAQKNNIKQFYIYQIGETADYNNASTSAYDLMGLYENLKRDGPGQQKLTDEGKAYKTTSLLLYNWEYDSARTHQLQLPSTIDGAAFKKGDQYRYVLWAKTHIDKSEEAHATYSFPASFGIDSVYRYEWNYSADRDARSVSGIQDISLTGTPVFFTQSKVKDSINRPPVADAGEDHTIMLPVDSITLDGSTSLDQDGRIVSYHWDKTAGPASYYMDTVNPAKPRVTGLAAGVYTFTLTVTDDKGAAATDDVRITVNASANKSPIAHAGNDQSITLPVNYVQLDGSASFDPDGKITKYRWTQKAGPSTYTLSSANTSQTMISGLVPGVYVFTLTTTDNKGANAYDDIKITVNARPNKAPTANAGNNKSIRLPVDSVLLDGGASSDPDGKITRYEWNMISGPSDAVFGQPDGATVLVSDLQKGTYLFKLTVTDSRGATNSSNMKVVVKEALNEPPVAMAGEDHTITLPENITLNGTKSYDPDGEIVTYQWSKSLGPDAYTFSNARAAKTQVSGLTPGTYTFTLTVKDNKGAVNSDNLIIRVQPIPNKPPIADAGKDQVILLPVNKITLNGSLSNDPDGEISSFQWSQKSGPDKATFEDATSAKTKVSNLKAGTYVFTLMVTDDKGTTAKDEITVVVNQADNKTPQAVAGDDVNITLPKDSVILDGSASNDPDGKITSFKWSQESGPDKAVIENAANAKTKISGLKTGTYVLVLTVTDNKGTTAKDEITVVVNQADNKTPQAVAGDDLNITLPKDSVILDGSASNDPDGKITSFKWSQKSGPDNAVLENADHSTAKISSLKAGTYVFTLAVTDDKGITATDEITVVVNQANNKTPQAVAGDDVNITLPKDSVILDGSASNDPDGKITSFKWSQESGPDKAVIENAANAKTKISGLKTGTYVLILTVTDNKGTTAKDEITVVVNQADNKTPQAVAGDDLNITLPKDSVILDGSASNDPDGKITSFKWSQESGPDKAVFANATSIQTKVSGLKAGIYTFTLIVTDDKGATAKDEVTVVVNQVDNKIPQAIAGDDVNITLPEDSIVLDGSASNDPDGKITSFKWSQESGPDHALLENAANAKTKISGLKTGTYVFVLTVTDDKGATAKDEITVVVNQADNKTPQAVAGDDLSITLPKDSVTLDGSASNDPDGKITSFKWSQESGPDKAVLENATSIQTKVSSLKAGAYVFVLTITDDKGITATDEVSVVVNQANNKTPQAVAGDDLNITLPQNSVTLDGSASNDPDGKITSFKWSQESGPDKAVFVNATSVQTKVSGLKAGIYVFVLTITDDKGITATDEVSVVVNQANNKTPQAVAGDNINITLPEDSIVLDGSASNDPDGKITSFKWSQESGPDNAVLENATSVQTKVSGLKAGTYVFILTTTDDKGATATDQISVFVNIPPIAKARNSNMTIFQPKTSTILDGTPSSDPDGSIINYKWVQKSGPTKAVIAHPHSATTKISNLGSSDDYIFTLIVTDNKKARDSTDISVGVYDIPNKYPVANAGDDQTITLPANTVVLDGGASYDPDGKIIQYQWEQTKGPYEASLTQIANSKWRITELKQGYYEFKLTVKDNNGAQSTASVGIFVLPPDGVSTPLFYIYPNPVTGSQLKVVLNKSTTGNELQFRIIDINGRVLKIYNFGPTPSHITKSLDISELISGFYFIQLIESKQLRSVKKFFKN